MEKYRLVQERKAEESEDFLQTQTESFPEVRITQGGKPRNYISYAMNLFVRLCSSYVDFTLAKYTWDGPALTLCLS